MIAIKSSISSNVRLTRIDRLTGKVVGVESCHNDIADIDKLLDLIDGSAADHLSNSAATFRIKNSGGGEELKVVGQEAGYPTTPAAGSVTLKFADESANTYDPDDIELYTETTLTTKVAEVLNVAWPNKPASENWYFEWDIDISSSDGNFDDAGFNGMLECIVGASSQHWDGTEGSNNIAIKVYDGTPGTLQFSMAATAATTRTSTSMKWTFKRSSGAATWSRVETHNNAQTKLLYDDDFSTEIQGADDEFTYTFQINFS